MDDPLGALVAELDEIIDDCRRRHCRTGYFAALYRGVTADVRRQVLAGSFTDSDRMAAFTTAFAQRYLDAHRAWRAGHPTTGSWAVAFAAASRWRPLVVQHLLLGMNAHINFDLAPALLEVISSHDFDDATTIALRRADHAHIDTVLARRVAAEDAELRMLEARRRSVTDRLLQPLNQLGTKRFLRESRTKVWHNAGVLDRARRVGPAAHGARIAALEELSRAKVTQLGASRWVILELAHRGFGVELLD